MSGSFEKQLETRGVLLYTNVGDSMWPLLRQGRDLLIIRPVQRRLKRYDVPLYKRDSGQYVLHRILWVRKDGYVLCGDNRTQKERGITDRHVIGVLTAVVRDGKELSVTDWRYRLYAHLWCDFFYVRVALLWARSALRFVRKKLKRRKENR